ncbi:MAG: isoprenylcysteine carboxylmethyltransferase family protein [Thermoplasmata archaeon]
MLSLLLVQIGAGISLAGVVLGFLVGRLRLPQRSTAVRVIATRTSVVGMQAAWILGVLLAMLWPVGAFVAPPYAYHWPALPDFPFSWVVQILGIVLGVAGGLLYSRSARLLGRQMTPVIRVQEGHQLMQTGPYRYIRHPVYTAILAVALGQTFFFLSLPLALLTLMLTGLAYYRARLEESLLRSPEAFGATYDLYMARTGRFLPRWSTHP